MKLSELIAAVGDENVKMQNVIQSMGRIDMLKDGTAKITFYTDAMTASEVYNGNPKMLGLIVWLPRDKLPETKLDNDS